MSYSSDNEDNAIYKVVMNHEEQYSILLDYKEIPGGWQHVGKTGSKAECLAYVNEVWTDMRPLSLRKKMEELAKNPPLPTSNHRPDSPPRKTLVDRLCEGDHAVEVGLRPEKTVKIFKEAIDRDYVHIKFPETKGGTELGFRVDRSATDLSEADFENKKGTVHLEGNLTLDYVRVKCVADIELSTLAGRGHLVRLNAKDTVMA